MNPMDEPGADMTQEGGRFFLDLLSLMTAGGMMVGETGNRPLLTTEELSRAIAGAIVHFNEAYNVPVEFSSALANLAYGACINIGTIEVISGPGETLIGTERNDDLAAYLLTNAQEMKRHMTIGDLEVDDNDGSMN